VEVSAAPNGGSGAKWWAARGGSNAGDLNVNNAVRWRCTVKRRRLKGRAVGDDLASPWWRAWRSEGSPVRSNPLFDCGRGRT
jgi:hypothetical protein